jgi:mercuric ion transport protein
MRASGPSGAVGVADSAGVFGAVFAALCCAGTPIILSALAALGLSFLRSDPILWPLMLASLLVALWGFWKGQQLHRSAGPLMVGLVGAGALTAGVIFVHGFPAKELIGAGTVCLIAATIWNIMARRSCAIRTVAP